MYVLFFEVVDLGLLEVDVVLGVVLVVDLIGFLLLDVFFGSVDEEVGMLVVDLGSFLVVDDDGGIFMFVDFMVFVFIGGLEFVVVGFELGFVVVGFCFVGLEDMELLLVIVVVLVMILVLLLVVDLLGVEGFLELLFCFLINFFYVVSNCVLL